MRIQRLVIEGFGPFADRQEIDFAPLDEAGLFLITGRTGSGKSTILDAICFALYGTAPRYDGALARLRSDHAALGSPTRVELELTVAGDRWRIVRSPEYERPKQRGSGTTREAQAAMLERWQDDGWVGVAARPVDVAEHLQPVLQLTREQFLQVILLAQGRFQEFLKAKTEDRLGLLRALFGTERFQRFESEIAERAKALEQAVGLRSAALRADLERLGDLADDDLPESADAAWADGVARRLTATEDECAAAAEAARAVFTAADRAAATALAQADLQRRRATARAALARLDEERGSIEAARARIAEAVRVLPALPAVETAARAAAGLAAAQQAVLATDAALGEDVQDTSGAMAELDRALGALADRLTEERDLPRLRSAAGAAEQARTQAEERLAEVLQEAAGLPDRRGELQQRRARADADAGGGTAAQAEVARAQRVAEAVVAAERAANCAQRADRALEAALAEEQEALARTRRLVGARLAGAAGLLAAELRDDTPCPVCGALEHPAPAEGAAQTPDEADLTAAEHAQQTAAERRAAASTASAAARAELAAAAATADGATADSATESLRVAQVALEAARRAAADRDAADALLADLDLRAARLDEVVATARSELADRADASGAARIAAETATARIAAARGEAASVADRIEGLRARRAALAAADTARRQHESAIAAHDDTERRLAHALAEAGLPDAEAARAAALPPADRAELEQRVRAWETERDGATAQLADRELAAAPEDPIDLEGAAQTKAAALLDRDAAADRAATARWAAATARDLAAAIADVDAAIGEDRARLDVVGPLADVVRGGGANGLRMRLESYVLAARLEQIVAAANLRLKAMTDGRFTLQHDDGIAYRGARSGLGLQVLDEHTGRPRPVASLSGGETFLASLALALGLAEVVSAEAGGVRLDTLFVDEGFGSLDRRTLDTAMETLDSLRAGGRTVGLISHVEAMQEDIPAGLHVERLPDGSSAVRARLLAPL